MSNIILQERAQSGFPLSIGTGLALETIMKPTQAVFDDTRVIPDNPDKTQYTDYLINVSTLARNLISSIKSVDLPKCSTRQITETLMEEIDYLKTLFHMQEMRLHLYSHSYAYAHSNYKDKLRVVSTDQQRHNFNLLEACVKAAKQDKTVLSFSKDVSLQDKPSALIITHVPFDLLSYGKFKRLDLLESHTGVIKTRKDWNSKYFKFGEKDMSFLPFMEFLLVTFGDNVMIKPGPTKEREKLYSDLLKKKVHPLMTEMSLLLK